MILSLQSNSIFDYLRYKLGVARFNFGDNVTLQSLQLDICYRFMDGGMLKNGGGGTNIIYFLFFLKILLVFEVPYWPRVKGYIIITQWGGGECTPLHTYSSAGPEMVSVGRFDITHRRKKFYFSDIGDCLLVSREWVWE